METATPLYNVRKTIAHLIDHQARRSSHRVVYFHKPQDYWVPRTWRDARRSSLAIMAGLWKLGLRHGDRVAVLSNTRPAWATIDQAVLTLGGVTVGIYPTSTAEQTAYILDHSESRVAFLENAEQLEKVRSARDACPGLEQLVLIDPVDDGGDDWQSLESLISVGEEHLAEDPELPDRCLDGVQPEDVATLVYTSGTTGPPKGVVLTHLNLFEICDAANRWLGSNEDDVGVVFLPLAHSLQRVASYGGVRSGATGYYAPAIDRLPETWQAAQPTVVSSVPRIFEKIHARIMNGLSEAPPKRQKLFEMAMKVAYRYSDYRQRGEKPPPWISIPYALFDKLIFSKVRERTFGNRVRFLVSGGAPISVDLLKFFHAVGLLILEGYGLTETSAPATLNQPHDFKFGTVGRALPGVKLKIAADGEILIKSPGLFREYYKSPEATAEAIDSDGWFHSGDIGTIDDDGFLKITDRKKDLIITAGGKNIAPQNIENLVKNHPLISQMMVYGDRRKYLVALVTVDVDELASWATRNGKSARSIDQLVDDPDLIREIEQIISEKNKRLAKYETIKKFKLLTEDFSVENGMLTPTLKVKRRVITTKYAELLDSLY